MHRGDPDLAIEDYSQSIRCGAVYGVDSYPNRAAAFLRKGNYDRAIADLSKAVELWPEVPRLRYLRAGAAGQWTTREVPSRLPRTA